MSLPLRLPTLHHTEESARAQKMGIESPLSSCEVKEIIFYHVDAISPYTDTDGTEYSSIHTNGSEYLIDMPLDQLEQEINKP